MTFMSGNFYYKVRTKSMLETKRWKLFKMILISTNRNYIQMKEFHVVAQSGIVT